MTDDFQETPEETLIAFAKMILASAGYSVARMDDGYRVGLVGHPSARISPQGRKEATSRIQGWADCADHWVRHNTEDTVPGIVREVTDNYHQGRRDLTPYQGHRERNGVGHSLPMVKIPKPPMPVFPEWPS